MAVALPCLSPQGEACLPAVPMKTVARVREGTPDQILRIPQASLNSLNLGFLTFATTTQVKHLPNIASLTNCALSQQPFPQRSQIVSSPSPRLQEALQSHPEKCWISPTVRIQLCASGNITRRLLAGCPCPWALSTPTPGSGSCAQEGLR